MDKIILILSISILFLSISCNKKKDMTIDEMESLKYEEEPEIYVPDEYFSAIFYDEGGFNHQNHMYHRFRCDIFANGSQRTYWVRYYSKSDRTVLEYRFYNMRKDDNYIIVTKNVNAFYINWVNKKDNEKCSSINDIGKYTNYLETNLTKEIIKNIFPDVKCNINIKHPKCIKMKFGAFYPQFDIAFPEMENLTPIFEF